MALVVAVAEAAALVLVLVPVLKLVREEVVEREKVVGEVAEDEDELVAVAGVVELELVAAAGVVELDVEVVEVDVRTVVNPELVVAGLVLDVGSALDVVTVGVNVPGTFPAFLLNVYDAET